MPHTVIRRERRTATTSAPRLAPKGPKVDEPWQIWRDVTKALGGSKRVRVLVGNVDASSVARWGRAPFGPSHLTGTGGPGILDHVANVIRALGKRPDGRVLLLRLRAFLDVQFRDALHGAERVSLSDGELRQKGVAAFRTAGTVLDELLREPSEQNRARMRDALLEVCAHGDKILEAIDGISHDA